MKKPRGIIILLLLISCPLMAQKVYRDPILFSGFVYESDSMKPLTAVHFLVNKIKGGITGTDGQFNFHAFTGDTIRFSYMGYKPVSFILADTMLADEYLVGIRMTRDTIPISEVVIFPRIIGKIETAMQNNNIVSRQSRNAMQNIQIAKHQGLTSQPVWDADQHTKNTIQQQNMRNMEKGMISSNDIVSFTAIIPFTYMFVKNQANKGGEREKLTFKEEYKIKSILFRDIMVE